MGTTDLRDRGCDPERLTDKQRRFCAEYVKDYNGKRAVIAAGYSEKGAAVRATKLLKNPLIKATVGKAEKIVWNKSGIDAAEVVKHLHYLSTRVSSDFVDSTTGRLRPLNEMNERAQACIDGFEVEEFFPTNREGEVTGRIVKTKIRLSPKASGVDMALKHKGLYAAVKEELTVKGLPTWDEILDSSQLPEVNPVVARLEQEKAKQLKGN